MKKSKKLILFLPKLLPLLYLSISYNVSSYMFGLLSQHYFVCLEFGRFLKKYFDEAGVDCSNSNCTLICYSFNVVRHKALNMRVIYL